MTLQSSALLPALLELPGGNDSTRQSFREIMTGLVSTDRAMYAAEFASGASFGLWAIFGDTNVDDTLASAYEAQYTRLAEDHSLHEHWQEMMERGSESMEGFVNGLKGKVAEFDTKDLLEARGWTNVEIAPDSTQPVWDISAVDPDGQAILIQVKSVAEGSASEIQGLVEANSNIHYCVSTEVYDKIASRAPDLISRMADIGSNDELEGTTGEGLDLLADNMGIDVPDSIVEIVPFSGTILASARLIHSVIRTEREFQAVDRTAKNKIQVVQTLTLMSRMGINTVLATVGGMGGTAIGSALPGIGNLVGGIGGTIVGAGTGMYLNQHLQPHMLDLALNITGLGHDDLFYYKNKVRIDEVALSFRQTAGQLAAVPRLPALPAAA